MCVSCSCTVFLAIHYFYFVRDLKEMKPFSYQRICGAINYVIFKMSVGEISAMHFELALSKLLCMSVCMYEYAHI